MDERKQLVLRLPPELHKELKIYAAGQEKTMTDLVIDWIKEKLKEGRKSTDRSA